MKRYSQTCLLCPAYNPITKGFFTKQCGGPPVRRSIRSKRDSRDGRRCCGTIGIIAAGFRFIGQIADRAGVNDDAPFEVLAHSMLLPDGIFKSYPQSLLDKRDFGGMNRWLRTIFDDDVKAPADEHETVDDWLASLDEQRHPYGVQLGYERESFVCSARRV